MTMTVYICRAVLCQCCCDQLRASRLAEPEPCTNMTVNLRAAIEWPFSLSESWCSRMLGHCSARPRLQLVSMQDSAEARAGPHVSVGKA